MLIQDKTFPEILALRAIEHSTKKIFTFLHDDDNQITIDYGSFYAAASRIAHDIAMRTKSGDRVVLLYAPGMDYISAFFGCMIADTIPVPCYPPTNKRNSGRVDSILQDCTPALILTAHGASQKLQQMISFGQWLEAGVSSTDSTQISGSDLYNSRRGTNDIAFLQYTSGSTSTPKGVMVTHKSLVANSEQIRRTFGLTPDSIGTNWLPPYHDMGLIGAILQFAYSGASATMLSPAYFLQQPIRWLRAISTERATHAGAPNFAYDLCVNRITEAQKAELDLSSWHLAFCGAEPIRAQTLERFYEAFKSCGFRRESLFPCYGLAEATLLVTAAGLGEGPVITSQSVLDETQTEVDLSNATSVSSGRPVYDQVVAIVDPESRMRVSDGTIGEIWVSGENVAAGYWGNANATTEAFGVQIAGDTTSPSFLRTGDLGSLQNGELYVAGRIKDVIILGGRNIYPQDVEAASCASHPTLRTDGAAAFAFTGDGGDRLVILQELDFRQKPNDELFGHIAAAVFDVTGVQPDVIALLKAGGIPRTSSGKIRRNPSKIEFLHGRLDILAQKDRGKAQTVTAPPKEASVEKAAPITTPQKSVAAIEAWLANTLAERLNLDVRTIDSNHAFSYYGVDSILGVELVEALSIWLERPLLPTLLWDFPSPHQLAQHLAGEETTDDAQVPASSDNDAATLNDPIAIIGLSCRFPQANDADAFWQLLNSGTDAVQQVSNARRTAESFQDAPNAAAHTRLGGFLDQVDMFDPHFFGISPREAAQIDPQQRLILEVSWEALENAAIAPATLAGTQTGVYIGISSHDYGQFQYATDADKDLYTATGAALSVAPNRLSYLLDLRGPSLAVDTACSSSLVSVHLACQSLRNGEATLALAGGVNLILSNNSSIPFATSGMLAEDGKCKAFDASANGYVRGEGCGVVVLKRLSDALRDGDTIRAVISGSAINQDGRSNGIAAPNGNAQAAVIRQALARAKILPSQIGYIEAHGTGTILGDPIELNALKDVLLQGRAGTQPCVIGSVKTNIGHLEAAAGIAGLIKTVLLLERRTIPPNLHYRALNPNCTLDGTPLTIATTLQEWDESHGVRHAGISSFGFGGTIAHIVVSEAPKQVAPAVESEQPSHLLVLSAKSQTALDRLSDQLAKTLRSSGQLSLADAAYTLQLGRNTFNYRRMLVASDKAEAAHQLAQREKPFVQDGHSATQLQPVVFMFPGQGAQHIRMAPLVYRHIPAFRKHVDHCLAQLGSALQEELRALLYPADNINIEEATQRLNQTSLAQPALFIIEYSLAQLWIEWGVQPQAMIGHSLGEYVAACVAGVFSIEAALTLVVLRGRLMQSMPGGAMISVAQTPEQLAPYLNHGIVLAAINAPARCVLAGDNAAIDALEKQLGSQEISCQRVRTSHAFHSPSMDPILDAFRQAVSSVSLHAPRIPYISNVTGTWITEAQATSPDYWATQLRQPVRFAEGLTTLATERSILLEVGPGVTLSGLARQNNTVSPAAILSTLGRGTASATSSNPAETKKQPTDLQTLQETLGRLWLLGHPVDWSAINRETVAKRVALPTMFFDRQRYWGQFNQPISTSSPSISKATMSTSSVSTSPVSAPVIARSEQISDQLRAIVAGLLQTTPDRVDPLAQLLELGADSLVLVQAVRSIETSFGVTLTIRQMFEELTTISDISRYLDEILPASAVAPQIAEPAPAPAPVSVPTSAPAPQLQQPQHAPVPQVIAAATPAVVPVVTHSPVLAPAPLPVLPTQLAAQPHYVPATGGMEHFISQQLQLSSQQLQLTAQQLQLSAQQLAVFGGNQGHAVPTTLALPVQTVVAPVVAPAISAPTTPAIPAAMPAAASTSVAPKSAQSTTYVPFQPIRPTVQMDPLRSLSDKQRTYLESFTARYTARTRKSRELTQQYRKVLSDNRAAAGFRFSIKEMLYPIVCTRSDGARIWDADGNEYIDLTMGFGVNLFGHQAPFIRDAIEAQLREGMQLGPQTQLAGEVAELVSTLTGMERVTFCNSGTEAVALSIRLSRLVSGRKKIAFFTGSFHGWGDDTLAIPDPQQGPLGMAPMAPGVQPGAAAHTLALEFGSQQSLDMIRAHAHELAAVLVEPVQSRRPDFQPQAFLKELRALTKEHGIALIFDEMITGFRLHPGGAQAWYGVRADMATYGKVVGGGMPVGLVAGSAHYLDGVDGGEWQYGDMSYPQKTMTFFAGTFCKHPLMLVAARAVLQKLIQEGPALQQGMEQRTANLVARLNDVFARAQLPIHVVHCGSLFRLTTTQNMDLLFYHAVARGLYIWEGRNMFLSTAHTDADIDYIVTAFEASIEDLRGGGFFPEVPDDGGGGGRRLAASSGTFPVTTSSISAGNNTNTATAPASASANNKPALWGVAKTATEALADLPEIDNTPIVRTQAIQFSLSFFGNYEAGYEADKYSLLFDSARFADQHGFAALWLPERHFHNFGGLSPNPSVLSAALARETSRIQLRAGSVVLPLHHPVRVAEEWSMVDNLSNGRVGIALASGWHPNDFVFAPHAYGEHRELMFTQLKQVQALWQGNTLPFKDGSGKNTEVKLFPMPKQASLPIWITIVNNPDTYRRAGEIGAGILTNLMGQTIADLEKNLRLYRHTLIQHGHDPAKCNVTALLHTFVTGDTKEAREIAREPFIRYLRSSLGLFQNMVNSLGLQGNVASMTEDDRDYLLNVAYGRYVELSALIGSPESCRNVIEQLHKIGVDEVGCFVDFGVDPEIVQQNLPHLDRLRELCQKSFVPTSPVLAPQREFPLTSTQQGMWLECQLDDEDALSYNSTAVVRLQGKLRNDLLENALRQMYVRHEALRTVIDQDGERQYVLPPTTGKLQLQVVDFTHSGDPAKDIENWHLQNNQHRFDIVHGPLTIANLLKISDTEHLLVLTSHHLITDGISQAQLLQEIALCYAASCAGQSPKLPILLSFADYVAQMGNYLQSEQFQRDESYWLKKFSGTVPSAIVLPASKNNFQLVSARAQRQQLTISGERYAKLQQVSRAQGCTLFMTMLAAVSVLLHRITHEEDLVVGIPMAAGRGDLENSTLIGCTLNIIAMRCNPVGDQSFTSYLGTIKRSLVEAYSHADYPFGTLLKKLNVQPDANRRPLAPIIFNLNRPIDLPDFGDLHAELATSPISYGQDELFIDALQLPDQLHITFQYKEDIFDHSAMQRMIGLFDSLLSGITTDASALIRDLPLLTAQQRNELLIGRNHTDSDCNTIAATLHGLFETHAASLPQHAALVFENQSLSYAELNGRANQLAHYLRSHGSGPGTLVGVYVERSVEMIVALLGILKSGAGYVPLDPAYPADRITYMLEDASPAIVLTQSHLIAVLPKTQAHVIALDKDWQAIAINPVTNPHVPGLMPQHPVYVMYTSGSTGKPKGVIVSHGNLVNQVGALKQRYTLQTEDRVLQFASISFDMSVEECFGALCSGATLVMRTDSWIGDAVTFWKYCDAAQVTVLNLPTAFWHQLAGSPSLIPACIRQISIGGEHVRPEIVEQWFRRSGHLPRLFNAYGPTEASVNATINLIAAETASAGLIGPPLANTRIYILDRYMQPVPVGVSGEIHIGGLGVTRGYLHQPRMTAERFVPDPFGNTAGARLYKTGDLGRWQPDGNIAYLGRNDHQVKLRGFRIELGEIETALSGLDAVHEAIVLLREDAPGDKRLVAYLVASNKNVLPTLNELRGALLQTLPEYMVPTQLVWIDQLPLTPNGKIDRRALPVPDATRSKNDYVAPRTAVEQHLADMWKTLLKLDEVSIHDNFFALGGHSLLATQMIGKLRSEYETSLSLRNLFESPTIATLAKRLDKNSQDQITTPEIRIPQANRSEALPLSFSQQRLWFLDQLESGSSLYNIPIALRLSGTVNVTALQDALNEIVQRHEGLRTRFVMHDKTPVQVIMPELALSIAQIDISASQDTDDAIQKTIEREARQPFNLSGGPLLRASLLKLAPTEHIMLLTMHHIVSDGWSMGVLLREIAALYTARINNQASPLAPLPLQYADFASWQQQWIHNGGLKAQLDYWTTQLADAPTLLALPTDRPRPARQSYRGATLYFTIPATVTRGLHAIGEQTQTTLFMTLAAAFNALLYRHTTQTDICIGTPIANRNLPEVEALIGCFINTLVLRTQINGNISFTDLLQQIRTTALEAYANQDLPFEQLVETVQPERSMAHSPLFQVMLILQNAPLGNLELPGLQMRQIDIDSGNTRFDLTLELAENEDGLAASFEYNVDLFDHDRIQRLAGHFTNLLAGIASSPATRIADLPLLNADETGTLINAWNQTASAYPTASIHHLFEAQVNHTPHSVAVVFGDQSYTYADLNARANQLAYYLQEQGVGPEKLVALCVGRSAEMVISLLAILKAGGAYIPLDPAYPQDRLTYMLEDAKPAVLLTQSGLLANVPSQLTTVLLDRDSGVFAGYSTANPLRIVAPSCLAYVIYTSGSTGKPKGVGIAHGNVVNFLQTMQRAPGMTAQDILLAVTSLSFDIAGLELWLPLISGSTVILANREQAANSEQLVSLIERHNVSMMQATPSTWRLLLAERWPAHSIKVLCGGEALQPNLAQQILAHVPQIWNLYGPTETTIWSAVQCITRDNPAIVIGHPIANTQLYILDDTYNPAPVGVAGELFIAGDGLARGYLHRAGLSAEKFVPNPFGKSGSRMYRTGDLARWLSNGTVDYLGRLDHQVKIRGFRIELGEIEAALATLPNVREVVVVTTHSPSGDTRLVAYLVPRDAVDSNALEPAVLRSGLQRSLPDHMIPSYFITLERFPLTANGKLDRRSLPAPDALALAQQTYVAPASITEQALAAIWSELLLIPVDRIGIHDNFFALGGHSLLATQVVVRVREVLKLSIQVRDFFAFSSLQTLAAHVEKQAPLSQSALPSPISRNAPLRLSYMQERAWLVQQLHGQETVYNMPAAVRIRGALSIPALQDAFNALIARHEILRTTFISSQDNISQQVIAPHMAIELAVVEATESELIGYVTANASHVFNLTTGPLVKATILKMAADDYVLVLNMHHIISDGWSMGVFMNEIQQFYAAHRSGQQAVLPMMPIQYADFAHWQREQDLTPHLTYWMQSLAGYEGGLPLPYDRLPVHNVSPTRTIMHRYPDNLAAQVMQFSLDHGATLFMTLHASLLIVLQRYTGRDDLCIGTTVAGRGSVALEQLIGFFVNILPLRVNLAGDPDARTLLNRVRDVALEGYEHQAVPFEHVLDALLGDESHSARSYVPVMMRHQNLPDQAPTAWADNLQLEMLSDAQVLADSQQTAKCELDFQFYGDGASLEAIVEYASDLFDPETVERLLQHHQQVLEEMVANPARKVSQFTVLTLQEQDHFKQWNNTAYPIDTSTGVAGMFEKQAALTPERVACFDKTGSITYAELNTRANRLAHALRAAGVVPESRIGVYLDRSVDFLVAMIGIFKAGGAYVPLDVQAPEVYRQRLLHDAQPYLILSSAALKDRLPGTSTIISLDDDFSAQPDTNPVSVWHIDHLVHLAYTSGSTGTPKGVLVSYRQMLNWIQSLWKTLPFGENEVMAQKTMATFSASMKEMLASLLAGVPQVIIADDDVKNTKSFIEILRTARVTRLSIVPSHLQAVLDDVEDVQVLASLRCCVTTGEQMPQNLRKRVHAELPWVTLWNNFGCTELNDTTYCPPEEQARNTLFVPIGAPIINTRAYVLDKHGNQLPIGVPGELCVSNNIGMARGYWMLPELSAQRFVPDNFSGIPGARMYRTGDLVRRLANGSLEYLGREDFEVKVRGHRIDVRQVELALMAFPNIRQAAVAAWKHEGLPAQLVAYYVASESLDIGALRDHLVENLPSYMVPGLYVALDTLPYLPNGKLNRKALPEPDMQRGDIGYVAPRNPTEELLATLWAGILKRDKIGVTDNFFEFGGNSLLIAQLNGQLNKHFPGRLTIVDLFTYSNIEKLAAFLAQDTGDEETPSEVTANQENRRNKAANIKRRRAGNLSRQG